MAQCVDGRRLDDPGAASRRLERPLKSPLVQVMPADLPRPRVPRQVRSRKDPLPYRGYMPVPLPELDYMPVPLPASLRDLGCFGVAFLGLKTPGFMPAPLRGSGSFLLPYPG